MGSEIFKSLMYFILVLSIIGMGIGGAICDVNKQKKRIGILMFLVSLLNFVVFLYLIVAHVNR